MTPTILWLSLSIIGLSVSALVYPIAAIAPAQKPVLGYRGNKRGQMAAKGGLFTLIEPLMRVGAGWISRIELTRYRARIDNLLIQAGDHIGITPDEFLALSVLSALLLGTVGVVVSRILEAGVLFSIVGVLLGTTLPYVRIQSEIKSRFKEINRTLPAVIDLAALCMGAGSDFPGAIRLVVNTAHGKKGIVEEEFGRILQEIEVGHTRKEALEAFLLRAPTDSVRDFVNATVQAEQKGNPLSEVLQIQAQTLRLHRSVAAEEAAARAGLLMMIPLMLLLCCILLVLIGPFIINGIG
jgi:tight adherence protein C